MTNNTQPNDRSQDMAAGIVHDGILDFNNARRRHFSPEEMKLCRQLEAEFDIKCDDDEFDDEPAGNGHDPDPTPPRNRIDFNGAPLQGKPRRERIDAKEIGKRLADDAKGFVEWLFSGRAA